MTYDQRLEQMHVLANSVRRTYNSLRHTTDQIHAETGISAPKRTLLMDLYREGPVTVPALAASRFISRQIIQTQINDLKKEKLVEAKPNREHQRSKLITLTAKGQKTVQAMIDAENAFIQRIGWLPEEKELGACIQVLDAIYQQLGNEDGAQA